MLKKLCLMASCFLLSISASAAIFTCNLQKIPPIGVRVALDQFIKVFTFDTADAPADTVVAFKDLRLFLHSDGKYIRVKISNATHEAVSSISSYESEIYLQLDDDAVGSCFTEDATKGATSLIPIART